MQAQVSDFGNVLLYLIGGGAFLGLIVLVNKILAPYRPNPEKLSVYECGEDPIGNANVQFNVRFYVIGLVFLIFDVEILFLFPWVTVFADPKLISEISGWGIFALIEMSIFVLILLIGLIYLWIKGDLEWIKPNPIIPERVSRVPDTIYEEINQRYATQ